MNEGEGVFTIAGGFPIVWGIGELGYYFAASPECFAFFVCAPTFGDLVVACEREFSALLACGRLVPSLRGEW